MAYDNWLIPSKTSGGPDAQGRDSVTFTADVHTGRATRVTTATFIPNGSSDGVPVTITQTAKDEFVLTSNQGIGKEGGTLTLTGTSNSSKLTFTKTSDGIGITIPSTYTADGMTTGNGEAIGSGTGQTLDPGADHEFTWSISFSIPANTDVTAKTCTIVVTPNGGQLLQVTSVLTLAAGDPTLSVSPSSITIPAAGSPGVTVTVTTNTSYTVV